MSTYSVYNLLVDNTFAFPPGITAGYILGMNADGSTSWIENRGGGGSSVESLDGSILKSLDINGTVNSIEIQSDKKILIGGDFTLVNGISTSMICRINPDLSLDMEFLTNIGSGFNDRIMDIRTQPDGKILVCGNFNTFNGLDRGKIVRLNINGTEDTDFYANLGTGFNDCINTIELDANSKILLGGDFTSLNGFDRSYIVKLRQSGKEDRTYSFGMGPFNSGIKVIRKQNDGKTLIGGSFTSYNSNNRNYLIRVDYYGAEDVTFYNNLGDSFNDVVSDIQIDNNNIFIGGEFNTFNSNTRKYFIKLNIDGIEDTTFYSNLVEGFNSGVKSIKIQPNGKIIAAGSFTDFNGNSCNRIVRLGVDGSFDTRFQEVLPNINNNINITNTIDGYIYIGGEFSGGFISLYNYSQLVYKKPTNPLIYNLPVPSIKLSIGTVSITTWSQNGGLDDDAVLSRYPICITTDLSQELIDKYEVRVEMLLYKRKIRKDSKYAGYIIADRNYDNILIGPQFLDTGDYSFSRTDFSDEWTRGGGKFELNRFNQYRVKSINAKIPVWEYLHSRFKYYDIKYRSIGNNEDSVKACIFIQNRSGRNRIGNTYAYSPYYCPLYICFRYVVWVPEADYGRGQYVCGPTSKTIKVSASFFPFKRDLQEELNTGFPTASINNKFIYNYLSCWFQDG
jgi:uncharacterized delta-60 repeat protein